MTDKSYFYSDLATERRQASPDIDGVEFEEGDTDGFMMSRLKIKNEAGEAAIGRPKGNYVTLSTGKTWLLDEGELTRLRDLLAAEIKGMAKRLCDPKSVLIAGLGNRALTADALGPLVTDDLVITRHVKLHQKKLFGSCAFVFVQYRYTIEQMSCLNEKCGDRNRYK